MIHKRIGSVLLVVLAMVLSHAALAEAQSGNGSTKVYVTKTGAKYHQANCSSLRKSAIPMTLAEAAQRYGPCGNCRPPALVSGGGSGATRSLATPARPATGGRCQATTKKGAQCSRTAKPGSQYCWQHGG